MTPLLIPICFFFLVFGIVYLYYTTRNRERMALIEKGADASIFFTNKKGKGPSTAILILLNLALLLICVGIAIFIGSILVEMNVTKQVAYPGSIFFMSGIGLLVGFFLTKKLEKEE